MKKLFTTFVTVTTLAAFPAACGKKIEAKPTFAAAKVKNQTSKTDKDYSGSWVTFNSLEDNNQNLAQKGLDLMRRKEVFQIQLNNLDKELKDYLSLIIVADAKKSASLKEKQAYIYKLKRELDDLKQQTSNIYEEGIASAVMERESLKKQTVAYLDKERELKIKEYEKLYARIRDGSMNRDSKKTRKKLENTDNQIKFLLYKRNVLKNQQAEVFAKRVDNHFKEYGYRLGKAYSTNKAPSCELLNNFNDKWDTLKSEAPLGVETKSFVPKVKAFTNKWSSLQTDTNKECS